MHICVKELTLLEVSNGTHATTGGRSARAAARVRVSIPTAADQQAAAAALSASAQLLVLYSLAALPMNDTRC